MTTTQPGATEHLVVDWTRCDGHGLCAALSGGAITLDDWGFPILPSHDTGHNTAGPGPARHAPEKTPLDTKTQRRIVSLCPSLALRLEQRPTRHTKETPMPHPANGAAR